jgi:hypothetical protein
MDIIKPVSESLSSIINNPVVLIPIGVYYVAVAVILGLLMLLVPGFWLAKAFFHIGKISAASLSTTGPTLLALFLIVAIFVFYIPSVLLNGIFIGMGEQLYSNSKVDIDTAYKAAAKKYIELFFAGIIFAALAITIIIGFGGATFLIIKDMISLWPVAVITTIAMVLLFAICIVYFFLINAAIIIGDNKLEPGIKQSFSIARAHGLEIFLTLLLMVIIFTVVDVGAAIIALIPVIGGVIYFIVSMFLATWFGILPVFVYHDLNQTKKRKPTKR